MSEPTKPKVSEVLPLALDYYAMPEHGGGGSLHVVLDDGNTEDSDVEFCRKWAIKHRDKEGERLAEILAAMSVTQREKLRDRLHERLRSLRFAGRSHE